MRAPCVRGRERSVVSVGDFPLAGTADRRRSKSCPGVPPGEVVTERLGDASITLTLDTYSHLLSDMQEGAAKKLEAWNGFSSPFAPGAEESLAFL